VGDEGVAEDEDPQAEDERQERQEEERERRGAGGPPVDEIAVPSPDDQTSSFVGGSARTLFAIMKRSWRCLCSFVILRAAGIFRHREGRRPVAICPDGNRLPRSLRSLAMTGAGHERAAPLSHRPRVTWAARPMFASPSRGEAGDRQGAG